MWFATQAVVYWYSRDYRVTSLDTVTMPLNNLQCDILVMAFGSYFLDNLTKLSCCVIVSTCVCLSVKCLLTPPPPSNCIFLKLESSGFY
jgi:hypothetical protein